jgi:hypothetical protein
MSHQGVSSTAAAELLFGDNSTAYFFQPPHHVEITSIQLSV